MYNELLNMGIDVKLAICGNDTSRILDIPYVKVPIVRIKYLRILTFWINGYLKFLCNYLSFKPNVVIFDIYSIWFSFPFAFLPKRKCIFIVDNRTPIYKEAFCKHPSLMDRAIKLYTKIAYLYCKYFLDGMTVITEHYKNSICDNYGFKEEKMGVWSSGVNIECFNISMTTEKKLSQEDRFVLIQHGEISHDRGLFETVNALRLLPDIPVTLLLIGDSVNSNTKDELRNHAERLGVSRNLIFKPRMPYNEIPGYIMQSDCAIMAYPNIEYWNNNNPIKLLEYMSLGKVIICTDMWTFRDVLKNSNSACYIKDNDPSTIANAIRYCYENRFKLKLWGKEGFEIVKNRFTWKKQAEELVNFIYKLCKNKNFCNL